jgi:hypothetical protein
MDEQRRDRQAQHETQAPYHSPIEEEFAAHPGDGPAPRDGVTAAGYSAGVIVAAIAILFLIGVVVALVVA